MLEYAGAVLFVIFVWWFSTSAILYLDRLPKETYRRSFWIGTALALSALSAIIATRNYVSPFGAYVAFVSSILLWGWHEMSFLMGFVTGPQKNFCPAEARGWSRFRNAAATLIHHELALAATSALLAVLAWNQPNQVGVWTFIVLWILRLSAKLNLFIGVRNTGGELMPEHLHYLRSYFGRAGFNPLMPISLVVATVFFVVLNIAALSPEASAFEQAGTTLVSAILGLGILEHLFLALPVTDSMLWKWAIQAARGGSAQ